jgi:hypothetical protein
MWAHLLSILTWPYCAPCSGKRFIFEKAHELGVRVIVVDGPDSWARSLVTEGIAEKFISVDMRDADTLFERTLAELKVRMRMCVRCASCAHPIPLAPHRNCRRRS